MKKRLAAVFFAIILCISLAAPALAGTEPGFDSQYPRVNDWADLLTDSEEAELQEKLDELSVRQQMDVIVVTAQDTSNGSSVRDFADDTYDTRGYGYGESKDGILLLICMAERDWYISTCGEGISVFTDKNIAYIGQQIRADLSAGNYADAFNTYADICDRLITQAAEGADDGDYDDYSDSDYEISGRYVLSTMPLYWIPLALGIGLVVALIVVGIMKSKLKSVRFRPEASSYLKKGSMNITESSDLFLYNTVSRTAKPKEDGNSSTHESSGGVTHGGGGGKF